jgi:hypothetical protein
LDLIRNIRTPHLMHWQISCLLFDKVGIVTTSRRLKLVNTAVFSASGLQLKHRLI